MYNNDIYPQAYSTNDYYNNYNNVGADYDYGMPADYYNPYPIPCPEYPSMPAYPMPPADMMPGMKMQCLMHLKYILEKMKDKKAALIIEGARGVFDCIKIMDVTDCMVVVETKNGVCVIPLNEITAVCMSREIADDVLRNKK